LVLTAKGDSHEREHDSHHFDSGRHAQPLRFVRSGPRGHLGRDEAQGLSNAGNRRCRRTDQVLGQGPCDQDQRQVDAEDRDECDEAVRGPQGPGQGSQVPALHHPVGGSGQARGSRQGACRASVREGGPSG